MFAEDLDAFLDTDELAIAATLEGGAVGGVAVLFDEAYAEFQEVAGVSPVAQAKASAVVAGDIGKSLTINDVAYVIVNRRPLDDGAFVALDLRAPDTAPSYLVTGDGDQIVMGDGTTPIEVDPE